MYVSFPHFRNLSFFYLLNLIFFCTVILADRPSPDGGEDPSESSNATAKENDVEIEITKTNLENGNVSMLYNDEKLTSVTPLPTVELVKKVYTQFVLLFFSIASTFFEFIFHKFFRVSRN